MNLFWFRRDLRVDDNTALFQAVQRQTPVLAIYIATPTQWHEHNKAPIQSDLVYRRLFELQKDLRQLGIPLLYIESTTFDQSVNDLIAFAQRFNCQEIYVNHEYEFNERQRDQQLSIQAAQKNMTCHLFHDKCVLAPGSVKNKQNDFFKVFTPFKKAYLNQYYSTQNVIKKITPAKSISSKTLNALSEFEWSKKCTWRYPRTCSHRYLSSTYDILMRLRLFCEIPVTEYHLTRDVPSKQGTSGLSPYLAIGALSAKQCLARLHFNQGAFSTGDQTWISEIIWRDFYQHLIYAYPSLCKGKSFLPWANRIQWHHNLDFFERWKQGLTGYPIVDAAMKQLNSTGWMHNRLRMIVASFLTKNLHIDWRLGEQYFMSKLIDGEFGSNNGGWQWSASTGCDAQPYFRIFNPTTQGEKFDPEGEFVRQWLPELKDVPIKFIHQPWRWSEFDSCKYSPPMVCHKTERALTLSIYKKARDV